MKNLSYKLVPKVSEDKTLVKNKIHELYLSIILLYST